MFLTIAAATMATANAGYINTAIPNSDFTDTVWENGITPNSHNNPHVVNNTYHKDGSDTDPNRVTTIDVHGAERITTGVSSALITGYSNNFTDVSPVIVYGVKNDLSNVVGGTISGSENRINGLSGGAVVGTLNNIETKHGNNPRSVFVLGSYNEIKSGGNVVGRDINIAENSGGANVVGNSVNVTAKNGVALGDETSVTAENAVALGNGSIANKANTVSVGSAGNERQITNVKAGTADTDAVNVKQLKDSLATIKQVDVSGKADKTYVDSQNQAQDKVIATKADKTAVDTKNATQDKEIAKNTKGIDSLNKSQAEQDKLIANKADRGYVDSSISSAVSGLASYSYVDSAVSGKANKSDLTELSDKVTAEILRIDTVNAMQNDQIASLTARANEHANAINGIASRVDSLEQQLSGGIAGSVAIGMMPTATEAGVKMVSVGTGHHNGETAIAIGFTGTTANGKYSFKVGSSYATSGGATFGGGVGYRF